MRGADISQPSLFITRTVEDFVPANHPLLALRKLNVKRCGIWMRISTVCMPMKAASRWPDRENSGGRDTGVTAGSREDCFEMRGLCFLYPAGFTTNCWPRCTHDGLHGAPAKTAPGESVVCRFGFGHDCRYAASVRLGRYCRRPVSSRPRPSSAAIGGSGTEVGWQLMQPSGCLESGPRSTVTGMYCSPVLMSLTSPGTGSVTSSLARACCAFLTKPRRQPSANRQSVTPLKPWCERLPVPTRAVRMSGPGGLDAQYELFLAEGIHRPACTERPALRPVLTDRFDLNGLGLCGKQPGPQENACA
jgi:hypothetical protein